MIYLHQWHDDSDVMIRFSSARQACRGGGGLVGTMDIAVATAVGLADAGVVAGGGGVVGGGDAAGLGLGLVGCRR